jgi:predicted esterase YcpF (UPF0227 family)
MVIYIHGFAGSGFGKKANLFREHYRELNIPFLAPTLSYVPDLAIGTLEEIIKNCGGAEVKLIGSSLGGFYAIYLANKFNLKAVLINPSTDPFASLKRIIDITADGTSNPINFFDLSRFEFNLSHLNMLKKYYVDNLNIENFFLLLQKDDDIIDYKIAKEKFKGAKMLIEDGGGHSFNGIEEHFNEIDNFFRIKSKLES